MNPLNLKYAIETIKRERLKVNWIDGRVILPEDLLGFVRILVPQTGSLTCHIGRRWLHILSADGSGLKLALAKPVSVEHRRHLRD